MKKEKVSYAWIYNSIRTLDFYSRIYIGQYEYMVDPLIFDFKKDWSYTDEMAFFRGSALWLRGICIPTLKGRDFNASLGIWSPDTDKNAVKAYDIAQVLRYQMAYHFHSEGGPTVDFGVPLISDNWESDAEFISKVREIIEKEKYPNYNRPTGNFWNCPIAIESFDDDEQEAKIIFEKPVMDIIQKAKKFYQLIEINEIYEAFKLLYPELANKEPEIEEICRDIRCYRIMMQKEK